MRKKDLNDYVYVYKKLLKEGDVQVAYAGLVKYVQQLRTEFYKELSNDYSVGNVLQGYMDYTYFYLSNDYLKSKKLKFGVVLNHAQANFEIWLLGTKKDVQEKCWELLKNTEWVKVPDMPRYSVFEVALVSKPGFENLDKLTEELKNAYLAVSKEIVASLKKLV